MERSVDVDARAADASESASDRAAGVARGLDTAGMGRRSDSVARNARRGRSRLDEFCGRVDIFGEGNGWRRGRRAAGKVLGMNAIFRW